jgi:hypothetical protein
MTSSKVLKTVLEPLYILCVFEVGMARGFLGRSAQKEHFYWRYSVEPVKVLFFGGLVSLVAEDSATLRDGHLLRRQAGVLALHLQHPADLPLVCPDVRLRGSWLTRA